MSSSLLIDRVREVSSSDEISFPGDFCIREVPLGGSEKTIHAIVLKCPYCGMNMMSTGIHRITHSRLRRVLSFIGIAAGVTVKPKLICPFNTTHSFSITNGRITPAT